MQIGDATHGLSRQTGDEYAFIAGNGPRELAFTDDDDDEDIDGDMLLGFLHHSLCRVNELACNNGGKSRHPRYGRRGISRPNPLSAITSHPPGPVTTPPYKDRDWGRESCRTWLAKAPIIGAGR